MVAAADTVGTAVAWDTGCSRRLGCRAFHLYAVLAGFCPDLYVI